MSMDDSCAVCADSLEWVAYGACGHREVCSTCVARLRFICDDRRCCICKTESDVVFVTKALGDYTRTIGDFSVFPSDATEGKNGSYWYHEDTGSFFDDSDQYKMIKAMCRLSCSVCDKGEEQGGNEVHRRRGKFRNIEHLKGHLYHDHKLHMCSLCLEGRKVFICEQKLYTRPQLSQHIKTGDSEVDGSESDRGGFMGHPSCEFCRKPFYGDNELYSHMSTEHYTCHICQRQQPGQFEYYKNYDDLEMHFRQGHFLCEDEACLAKKFIVFTSESEMKRHNAMEHGGHMSRSQRNSALQIPTSFQYRRSTEEDRRGRDRDRDRRRVSRPDSSENQLSVAIQASLETANAETRINDRSYNAQTGAQQSEYIESNEIIPPFQVLSTTDSEASARYRQALGNASSNAPLEESSFPPLPMAPTSSQQQHRSQQDRNSMAARLRRRNTGQVKVINSARGWSATNSASSSSSNSQALSTANYGLVSSGNSTSSQKIRPAIVSGPMPSSFPSLPQARPAAVNGLASASSASARNASSTVRATSTSSQQSRPAIVSGSLPSSFPSLPQARPAAGNGLTSASSPSSRNASSTVHATTGHGPNSASSAQARPAIVNGPMPSSYANLAQAKPTSANGLGSASSGSSRVSHSASAPNLVQRGSLDSSLSDFPPVSATLKNKPPPVSSPSVPIGVKDVQTANKSLVEKVRCALENDEDRYAAFKEISAEYRQGVIGTGEYLSYVQQFGLSHLVLDLARLCPDSQKQRELLDTYNAMVRSENARESGPNNSSNRLKGSKGSNKGKGKVGEEAASNPNDTLADSIISTVRKLQANYKPSEDVEVLSKDGYRASKGKSTASTTEEQLKSNTTNIKLHDSSGQNGVQLSDVGSNQNSGGGGGGKQKKKTSKFHRVRLGEGSAAALLNGKETEPEEEVASDSNPSDVRGVWRNGGGQKLVSLTAAKR